MPDDPATIPEPPSGETSDYLETAKAHDTYIRHVARLVLSDADPGGTIGRWVPYALFHHLVQLARGVQSLVVLGYSDEAMPLGRAMISATANLLFIVTSGNPDGWALRYWLQLVPQENRMLDYELQRGRFDAATIQRIQVQTALDHDGAIAAAAADGIAYPEKLIEPGHKKPRRDTWTGLSDRALFEHINLQDWHATEYDYLSTTTHVQAVSLIPLRDTLMDGRKPSVGPHFRMPLPAILASTNALKFAALAMVKHYSLSPNLAALDAASSVMSKATERYRADVGANAVVTAIFGSRVPEA